MTTLESHIEEQICFFLASQGISVEKVSSEGYFNEKRQIYQKRRSKYSRVGTSDIHATIPPYGRGLYIEAKRPEEMVFFDKPSEEHRKEVYRVTYVFKSKSPKAQKELIERYMHRLEQAEYIEEKIKAGAVAFFASSVEQVTSKLKDFGVTIS